MTYPIHPLRGLALRVLKVGSGRVGHRTIDVEHPKGGTLRIPEQWTDQALPVLPSSGEAKSTTEQLGVLARLVAAIAQEMPKT